ncbi:PDZ domain-containing protein MAGIX, partial [Passer montanus]|uniref:PDZ domain-containing protein MAGIX n=1 Tax=Passer montanus TaxID=9160 RepID=UPI001960B8CD
WVAPVAPVAPVALVALVQCPPAGPAVPPAPVAVTSFVGPEPRDLLPAEQELSSPSSARGGPGQELGWAQDSSPFAVELPRGPGGFGFSLRGGPAGVFVRGLREGGPAQRCGCIQVSDELLAINGAPTAGMSPAQALARIRGGGSRLRLLLRRPHGETPPGTPGQGGNGPKGHPRDPRGTGTSRDRPPKRSWTKHPPASAVVQPRDTPKHTSEPQSPPDRVVEPTAPQNTPVYPSPPQIGWYSPPKHSWTNHPPASAVVQPTAPPNSARHPSAPPTGRVVQPSR